MKKQTNVGIFQTAFLGDLILSIGFVRQVRSFYPHSKITFVCRKGFKNLLKFVPEIDEIVEDQKNIFSFIRLCKLRFDYFYVLHRSFRTSLLLNFNISSNKISFDENWGFFKKINRSRKSSQHELEKNSQLIEGTKVFLPSFIVPPLHPDYNYDIILAPKSQWGTKEWPFYFDLAKECFKNYKVAWIGIDSKPMDVPGDVLGISLPWEKLLNLFYNCKGVVCNDSSPLHFASAFNKPSLSFWGPTSTEFGYGPYGNEKSLILEIEKLECRPCHIHGPKTCPLNHHRCMLDLEISEIKHKVNSWIKSL